MTGRYVDKELHRRRNRRKKMRKLRMKLQETRTSEERKKLLDKMRRISVYPVDILELRNS